MAEKTKEKNAVTPAAKATPAAAATPGKTASGGSSKSPITSKTPDPTVSLSARLGGMVLLDKEAEGFVFEEPDQILPKNAKWSAVGKAFSPRPLNKTVLERTMQRAWGLHHEARFRDMGDNIFVVHFGSEGDWRHAMTSGPWQYDFNVLVLKEYESNTRPSETVFDKVDVWVRVTDLPPGKRIDAFGRALGNWLGEVVKVDVDKDGMARGNQLRVRARISIYEPLVRGFFLKTSQEDKIGTWFGFHYEKIPHFCFECGRLVHVDGRCDPPVDKSSQWGGWLRASPGRSTGSKNETKGGKTNNSSSFVSSQSDGNNREQESFARVRDIPTKRNLNTEFDRPESSRTGGQRRPDKGEVNSPKKDRFRGEWPEERDLRHEIERKKERDLREQLKAQQRQREYERAQYEERGHRDRGAANRERDGKYGYKPHYPMERRRGYYVRKPRQDHEENRGRGDSSQATPNTRKRRPRQMWVAKEGGDKQEGHDTFIRDTRQKTATVFDRISEHEGVTADPARMQGRREQ